MCTVVRRIYVLTVDYPEMSACLGIIPPYTSQTPGTDPRHVEKYREAREGGLLPRYCAGDAGSSFRRLPYHVWCFTPCTPTVAAADCVGQKNGGPPERARTSDRVKRARAAASAVRPRAGTRAVRA